MANLIKKQQQIKLVTPEGIEMLLVDTEEHKDCVVCFYCEATLWETGRWNESDLHKVVAEFEDQEIETVSGWEYPRYETRTVSYDDSDFDREIAIAIAVDRANDYMAKGQKGGVQNAA